MIKFVYFDVGGVAILDFSGTDKWKEMMTEIGVRKKDFKRFDEYWDSKDSKINLDLDIDALQPEIESKFKTKFPTNYSLLVNGFVMRFEKNTYIKPVIDEIARICSVGLLTNMYPRMFNEIVKRRILPDIKWSAVIDSSVEKVQKPEWDIFEIAENKCGFKGGEILFVDNSQKNLDVANELDWHTVCYDPKNPKKSSKKLATFFRNKML